jgi:hypothetical protein
VFGAEPEIKLETIDLTQDEDGWKMIFDMTGDGCFAEEPIEVY